MLPYEVGKAIWCSDRELDIQQSLLIFTYVQAMGHKYFIYIHTYIRNICTHTERTANLEVL